MKIALRITGMHCDSCIQTLKAALTQMRGVHDCDVRLGDAVVTYDEAVVTRADILAAVRAAGAFEISGFSSSR
ncbi:MAG: heavy-metal-associated domain-containing protein [Phycisphaerae bacterium]